MKPIKQGDMIPVMDNDGHVHNVKLEKILKTEKGVNISSVILFGSTDSIVEPINIEDEVSV